MKIEVTENEAIEIYSMRYSRNNKSGLYWLVGFAIIAIITYFLLDHFYENEWLGLCAFLLFIPGIWKYMKILRMGYRYAKSEIEKQS